MSFDVQPDWWKSLFDEIYLLTDARTVNNDDLTRREVDMLCELLPLKTNDRVLDLCGGQGRHSLELASRGFGGCVVFDFSAVLLEKGRAAAEGSPCPPEFIQGDASETGLPDANFDHVLILGNSLGYLPEPSDDVKILREAHRMLRLGGYLLVDVTDGTIVRDRFNPNAWHEIDGDIVVCRQRVLDNARISCRELVLCKDRGLLRDRTYAIRTYDAEVLEHLFRQAGFTEVKVQEGFAGGQMNGDLGFMNHRLVIMGQKTG